MTDDKRQPGRPALPPEQKLVVVPVRLNAQQKATLQQVGQQALRDWLDLQTKRMARQAGPTK